MSKQEKRPAWHYVVAIIAALLLRPAMDYLLDAPGGSWLGRSRNWLGAALLISLSALLFWYCTHIVREGRSRLLARVLALGSLTITATGCGAAGLALMRVEQYPGLWALLLLTAVLTAVGFSTWSYCIAALLRLGFFAKAHSPAVVRTTASLFMRFFLCLSGAVLSTAGAIYSVNEALRLAGFRTSVPSWLSEATTHVYALVSWCLTLPLSLNETTVHAYAALAWCAFTYFNINTTRWLILTGLRSKSPTHLLVGMFAGMPATLFLAYISVANFFFHDSPLRTAYAWPFILLHVFLMGCLTAGAVPPGISNLLKWRKHLLEGRKRASVQAAAEKRSVDDDKKLAWLLQNYDHLRLPQHGDVYKANNDIPLRAIGTDGITPCALSRDFVLNEGQRLVLTKVPCYLKAHERTAALRYLIQDIQAVLLSTVPLAVADESWIRDPVTGRNYLWIGIPLKDLMERFCFVEAGVSAEERGQGVPGGRRELSLEGLQELDEATATTVAQFNGDLVLDTITLLPSNAARALGQHRAGRLSLNGLKVLPLGVAQALAGRPSCTSLSLNGVTEIDQGAAETLSAYSGALSLDGVKTLTDAAARTFSQHGNRLSLEGLQTLSLAAEVALRARQAPTVGLPEQFRDGTHDKYNLDELKGAVETSKQTLGSDHRDTKLLQVWYLIARMQSKVSNRGDSLKQAMEISEKLLGRDHSEASHWRFWYGVAQNHAASAIE